MEPGLKVRLLAREALQAVLERGRPLDEALARALAGAGLEARDRGFLRLLLATALRRLGQIDALVGALLARPLPRTAGAARAALRLGAAQLLFLATPAHAAVHGAVASIDADSPYRGLVNAVLRRLAREGAALTAAQDAPRLNTPDWLWESWSAAYGEAACRAIATAHLAEPPLDLSLKGAAGDWAARLHGRLLPTGSLRITEGGPVEELPGFAEGAWWVQDAAAALPARLLRVRPGERVLDLCAAPGGKTAELAAAGAVVTALDRSGPRLARLRDNLGRLGLEARVIEADAADYRPVALSDAVLLDAPCSATGTIRRHPDVPWIKRPADLGRLAALQDRLLAAAARMLRPGGRLVYCVCSLQPEEGPLRIASFLAGPLGAAFRRDPVRTEELPGLAEAIDDAGDLRTLPCHWAEAGGMDGFYAARLLRTD
ncbi:MAG: RsmB/NOP family class I SAM-dependent RNA methyltransferase [Alphaproteobacteria bacterium]|nr:RsmB/NOP family class I SAM-dependent RNA methyltransferase [Alphaproteobacteria bacterium]